MKKRPSVSDLAKEVAGLRVRLRSQERRIEDLEEWSVSVEDAAVEEQAARVKGPAYNIEVDTGGQGLSIGMN